MTPHPEASAALASNLRPSAPEQDAPGPILIVPGDALVDIATEKTALTAALNGIEDAAELRRITVAHLSATQTRARAAIEAAFEAEPRASRALVSSYAYLTDGLVTLTFWVCKTYLHPVQNPTPAERISVMAVGGYGRAEMAPFSDVDLLFLTPPKTSPWAETMVESMLYILWDLRLKVGHATRTIKDCLRLGTEDFTIRTSMLELRRVCGDEGLANDLGLALWENLFKNSGPAFVEAKLEERAERHERQGGQRYVLEPNVKEGKGGLRDLQSLFWIAKYIHRVAHPSDLVTVGLFQPEEFATFEKAENFLWAVRAHLHLINRRAMDQLTFDMQVEVAERMGYKDTPGRRAVEHYMQDYFLHATHVGELTRILLTALEEQHVKTSPSLIGLFRRRKKVRPGYVVRGGRLDIENPAEFIADKLNLLRIFDEALRTGLLIHSSAMRLVAANLDLIDAEMQGSKEAAKIFFDVMLKHGNPERALRRMNELGVLAAFIPEFEPIVAMMQFNVYHSYTVDEHTIQTIKTLAQIEREELIEELPVASGILKRGVDRRVIYTALLMHDIGKGREEDHSILGAKIARDVAPRLGLKPAQAETVEWLVRNHLLMSDVAQKRDLSEPRTVKDFAKAVKTRKRLDLLCALTVCDIRGVGPNVWNNWKAMLLRSLYHQTAEALENGLEDINRENRADEAKRALRDALSDWPKKKLRAETARHYPPYWQSLPTATHITLARLTDGLADDQVRIDLTPDPDRDATRACFALVDHPGIFARIAGALAMVGANVVDARTFTSKDGISIAVFWLQDAAGDPYDPAGLPRLTNTIRKTLMGEILAKEALKSKDKMKKRERDFRFPTNITFDNGASDIYTVIEVDTRDRPGLLFDLARTLADSNIYISSAVVATYGAQAVDSFYVKDAFGLKLHSHNKQVALGNKLKEAIETGVQRANPK
ncbi:[protein-PII] uridylyltransferase [Harenicola maris]|uniref:[protein-PII] uridylyltransferase n=1 Tax=Harenicola maris TaxID=2841044 RepID=UPI002E19EFAF